MGAMLRGVLLLCCAAAAAAATRDDQVTSATRALASAEQRLAAAKEQMHALQDKRNKAAQFKLHANDVSKRKAQAVAMAQVAEAKARKDYTAARELDKVKQDMLLKAKAAERVADQEAKHAAGLAAAEVARVGAAG